MCPGGIWSREGGKKNTNISLFTKKVYNINKTSWHKQMVQGKLVLVLQALKICKYRFLRGDAKGWSALSVNKQDPRLIMKSFPYTYKDGWEMQLPSVISMTHNVQGSPQVQTGTHAREALVTHGQCIQQNTWSQNHFFVLPTISHSSESPSVRDAAMQVWHFIERMLFHPRLKYRVEHNKPALQHLEYPSCIPMIKFSQP